MEAVLVVQPVVEEPSVIFTACADGHVLRWELDADLNADSYKFVLAPGAHNMETLVCSALLPAIWAC